VAPAADLQTLAAQAASQQIAALQQQAAEAQHQQAQIRAALEQARREGAASGADRYLSGVSQESFEVLSHFGPEAPVQLNTYACQVEDALLEALQHQVAQAQLIAQQRHYIEEVQRVLHAAAEERGKLRHILTDGEALSDYTVQFFGPDGPMPVSTPSDQAREALQQGMVQADGPLMGQTLNPGFADEMARQGLLQRPDAVRPQFSMPQVGGGLQVSPQEFWSNFAAVSAAQPRDAWKVLAAAPLDALRAKVFVAEG
jgi:hypothetical protein